MKLCKKRRGHGSRSSFYKVSRKELGFKTFGCQESALYAYTTQKMMAEHGLAPNVHGEVCKVKVYGYEQWGFATEMAETIKYDSRTWFKAIRQKVEKLSDKCSDLGFGFMDDHCGNVGYVIRKGKRKLVVIDTGDESVSNESIPCSCITCLNGKKCNWMKDREKLYA
jgi:hypothetical protein